MKPRTHRPATPSPASRRRACVMATLLLLVAGASEAAELGRLFYTPAQRTQLETARTRNVTQATKQTPQAAPAPLRYDGVLIRSDGQTTRWVDGRPQLGPSGVTGLKPGQIRADGKVYEPYQVLRRSAPAPAEAGAREATP